MFRINKSDKRKLTPLHSAECDNVDYITLVHVLTNTVIVSIFDFKNRDMLKTFYDYDIR